MTMNTSWGYKWYDNNWKSAETLIQMLADIASKGGNLLLNVGPTSEGLIPDSSVVRLKQMGNWMAKNSESIYGTQASPFFKLPWGRCTQKVVNGNTHLYLHVFSWPKGGMIKVPGLKTRVNDVYLLANPKQKFAWKFEGDNLMIHTPEVTFDPINTVIVVKTKGKVKVESNMPALIEGEINLPADFADIHNPGYGTHAHLDGIGEKAVIRNWVDSRVRLEWMFTTTETGTYKIEAMLASTEKSKLNVAVGNAKIEAEIQAANKDFKSVLLGEIEILETGNQIISLAPDRENWNEIELMSVKLIKE